MPCDPNDCAMEVRIEALEQANRAHSNTHEKMFDRIRAIETENAVQNANYKAITDMLEKMDQKNEKLIEKVGSIEKNISAQLQTMTDMNERGKENKRRLDELESKPGKKWDNMSDKILWVVVGGIISVAVIGFFAIISGFTPPI